MPIQFHCLACGQPVEVDDDAANQPVTCPYCRRVSTAPATTDPNFDPRARPAAGPPSRPITPHPPGGQPAAYDALPPVGEGNKLGYWSLGLIVGAVVLVITSMIITAAVVGVVPTTQDPAQAAEHLQEKLADYPMLKMLSTVGSCILPLAALTLAVISLARGGRPKWPAYTTLGIATAGVVLMCIIISLQVSLGAGV